MKNIIYVLCLMLICCKNKDKQASQSSPREKSFVTTLSEYDLGSWALKQHNDICATISKNVISGKISVFGYGEIALSKEEAARLLEISYTAYISTDPDDPTIGYDTVIRQGQIEMYHEFIISGDLVSVKVEKGSQALTVKKKEFMDILTEEQVAYLENTA